MLSSVQLLSHVWFFMTPWAAAFQACPTPTSGGLLYKWECFCAETCLQQWRNKWITRNNGISEDTWSLWAITVVSLEVMCRLVRGHVKETITCSKAMRACMQSCFSCVWLFATLRTVAHQAPLSIRFSRQEHWIGLPRPSLGNLPDPGFKPMSPELQADSLLLSHLGNKPPTPTKK